MTELDLVNIEVLKIRGAQRAVHANADDRQRVLFKKWKGRKGKYNQNSKNDSMKCFNCGQPGHVNIDCRAVRGGASNDSRKGGNQHRGVRSNCAAERPTCWECGGKGHIGRDGPSSRSKRHVVSEMVDARHQVSFDVVGGIDVSRAAHEQSGMPMLLVRLNGVYEFDWNILSLGSEGAHGKEVRFLDVSQVMADDRQKLYVVQAARMPKEPRLQRTTRPMNRAELGTLLA